jgi:hypothetical protein
MKFDNVEKEKTEVKKEIDRLTNLFLLFLSQVKEYSAKNYGSSFENTW